ncbi:hypothetical protein NDU88_001226, partial [Pleurodeles waltl]
APDREPRYRGRKKTQAGAPQGALLTWKRNPTACPGRRRVPHRKRRQQWCADRTQHRVAASPETGFGLSSDSRRQAAGVLPRPRYLPPSLQKHALLSASAASAPKTRAAQARASQALGRCPTSSDAGRKAAGVLPRSRHPPPYLQEHVRLSVRAASASTTRSTQARAL